MGGTMMRHRQWSLYAGIAAALLSGSAALAQSSIGRSNYGSSSSSSMSPSTPAISAPSQRNPPGPTTPDAGRQVPTPNGRISAPDAISRSGATFRQNNPVTSGAINVTVGRRDGKPPRKFDLRRRPRR
jgi:hypothetical protein